MPPALIERVRATLRIVIAAAMVAAISWTAIGADAAKPPPNGDVARAWNSSALDAARATSAKDFQAARLYAMVNVAMYDAVNGLLSDGNRRRPALVPPSKNANGDPAVAAAQAAHDVLFAFDADATRRDAYDAHLAADVASAPAGEAKSAKTWGAEVASQVVAARSQDGTDPKTMPPFVIANPAGYQGAPPPDVSGIDYAAAFNEVKILGDADNADAEKDAIYSFWALGSGTDQPPGAWLQVAETVSASRDLSLIDATRLFALETMTMADTVAPTNLTKTAYNRERPTAAIHSADSDPNPFTSGDNSWTARAGTAGGPGEYWSGHSSFSGGAAEAIRGFFCDDHIGFSFVTDHTTGTPTATNTPRTFESLSQAATEVGRSRVFGGLHFVYSDQAGQTAGRAIADEVLATALLRQKGATHTGSCPL